MALKNAESQKTTLPSLGNGENGQAQEWLKKMNLQSDCEDEDSKFTMPRVAMNGGKVKEGLS